MKHFYLFLILFGTAVSAKNIGISYSNIENNLKNTDTIVFKSNKVSCSLNVSIGGTLDMPTSTFWVNENLNGTAPYIYLLDGKPSVDGRIFYAEKMNPGLHLVEVTDANGCKGSATFYSSSLSTSNFAFVNFKCYPNPVKNSVTISNTNAIAKIDLVSVNGNVLLTKQLNDVNYEVDLSSFSKGIYFLKINTAGTEKMIKLVKE
jgi:hypothetical protein